MHPKPPVNVNGVRFESRRIPHPVYTPAFDLSTPQGRARWIDAVEERDAVAVDDRRRNAFKWAGFLLVGFVVAMIALLALCVLAGPRAYGQTFPSTQPAATVALAPGTPDFIVAVDDQPSTILIKDANGRDQRIDNFQRWLDRGVNALYRSQKDEPLPQWVDRAAAKGFKVVPTVPFLPDGSVDVATLRAIDANPAVIGWTFEDEADRRQAIKDKDGRPAPQITFPRMQQITAVVRGAATKPIYLTFTGGGGGFDNLAYQGGPEGQVSSGGPGHRAPDGWFGLPATVVWDYHLWASGRPAAWEIHDRMQDRAFEWSGGKPQIIYIESSPQNLENKGRPGPTGDQYVELITRRVERAKEKGQNLKGIIIFPQKIGGGFLFDNTPADVVAVMPQIHGRLTGVKPTPTTLPIPPPATQPDPLAAVNARLDEMTKRIDALTLQIIDGQRVQEKATKAIADDVASLPFIRQPATRPAGAGQ